LDETHHIDRRFDPAGRLWSGWSTDHTLDQHDSLGRKRRRPHIHGRVRSVGPGNRGSELLMTPMRWIYLALAIWGAIHPMYYFVSWFQENGWNLGAMIDAWYVNDATTGLTWDLTIAAVSLTIWIIAEVFVRRNWVALIAIPATYCIGVSCGLPLYLFLRSKPIT
jgi:hypothetical protein